MFVFHLNFIISELSLETENKFADSGCSEALSKTETSISSYRDFPVSSSFPLQRKPLVSNQLDDNEINSFLAFFSSINKCSGVFFFFVLQNEADRSVPFNDSKAEGKLEFHSFH